MTAWTVPSYADDWTVPGYSEQREIGRGMSGRVVEAVNDATGQRVAIKYLSTALARDPAFMWGFRTEAQMLRSIGVPQVVQVYDYVEQPGQGAAVVMELVNGVSLHEIIARRGAISPEAALVVLKGALLGLAAAHTQGVVHRDCKPGNILVDVAGNSKLSDFGVALKMGKHATVAGTPAYLAPEQWMGAPASPATDIYAVTAVFFECLTGHPPFTGKPAQLQEQHVMTPVPADQVAGPLQGLVSHGLAKNAAGRPPSAIVFVAELESAASAAYGPDWEERGRAHLAELAGAVQSLVPRDGRQGSSASYAAARGRRRKAVLVTALSLVAVVLVGGVATAVTLKHKGGQVSNVNSSAQAATISPSFKAVANVSPPAETSKCTAATSFTYSGTITATTQGTVRYQWVYSAGKPGPAESLSFAGAGQKTVKGETVQARAAGGGWGEIKVLSPVASTSNRASYKLMCEKSGTGLVSASASVQVPSGVATCPSTPPTLTATGSVTSKKAGSYTYYWAQSDGQDSAPATLTFTGPGTLATQPLTFTPASDPGSGEAVLVVTGPAAATSNAATYSLTCTPPKPATLTASASVSPASQTLKSCTLPAPAFTFNGTITDSTAGPVSYYWKLPSGNGAAQTLTFSAAGSQHVTTTYTPPGDTASGSGTLVVTSPASVTSAAASFALSCGKALAVVNNAPATATVGKAYSGTVTVSGGSGTYTWAAVTGLPAGLTAKASGATLTISGTPTAADAATVTVTASDTESTPNKATATVTITVSAPALTITTSSLPNGTVATAYGATVAATGGVGAVTWSATGLPAGLTINAATGAIGGTPKASGTSTVAVTAKAGTTATASLKLVISPAPTTKPSASTSASASTKPSASTSATPTPTPTATKTTVSPTVRATASTLTSASPPALG